MQRSGGHLVEACDSVAHGHASSGEKPRGKRRWEDTGGLSHEPLKKPNNQAPSHEFRKQASHGSASANPAGVDDSQVGCSSKPLSIDSGPALQPTVVEASFFSVNLAETLADICSAVVQRRTIPAHKVFGLVCALRYQPQLLAPHDCASPNPNLQTPHLQTPRPPNHHNPRLHTPQPQTPQLTTPGQQTPKNSTLQSHQAHQRLPLLLLAFLNCMSEADDDSVRAMLSICLEHKERLRASLPVPIESLLQLVQDGLGRASCAESAFEVARTFNLVHKGGLFKALAEKAASADAIAATLDACVVHKVLVDDESESKLMAQLVSKTQTAIAGRSLPLQSIATALKSCRQMLRLWPDIKRSGQWRHDMRCCLMRSIKGTGDPQQYLALVKALLALERLCGQAHPHVDQLLCADLPKWLKANVMHISPDHIISIAEALADLGYDAPNLLAFLVHDARSTIQAAGKRFNWGSFLLAVAELHPADKAVQQLLDNSIRTYIKPNLQLFNLWQLVNIGAAYCTVKLCATNSEVVRDLSTRAVELWPPKPGQGYEPAIKRRLFTLLLQAGCNHSQKLPPGGKEVYNACADEYRSNLKKEKASGLQREVYDVLVKIVPGGHDAVLLEHPCDDQLFSIDICIKVRSHKIAVEVDGPTHFARTGRTDDGHELGHTVLRRHMLSLLGWRVVNIPAHEWRRKGNKVSYLKTCLSEAGLATTA